jgi:hypothetical protein
MPLSSDELLKIIHDTRAVSVWNRKTGKQMPLNGAYPFDNVKTILGLVISAPSAK